MHPSDIEVLNDGCLRAWCARIEIAPSAVDQLVEVSHRVQSDSALLDLFIAFHEQTALRGEWHTPWSPLPFDPLVEEKLGNQDSLFYLLAYLAALPYTLRTYQSKGYGEAVFTATMKDITYQLNEAFDINGYWTFTNFQWIWRHLSCNLFRLGRLQYVLARYDGRATAFRHRESGEVLMFLENGLPLNADGSAVGAGLHGIYEDAGPVPELAETAAWTSIFQETPEGWRGNPVSPYGYAHNTEVFLPRSQWERALAPGDTVLELHIPRGKDLTAEDVRASLHQAHDFFNCHHEPGWPPLPIRASVCHTWFFTPQLQDMLPPSSSIVRFQREFYLYPYPGGPGFLWAFVFGGKYPDPATAPRDTTLRRAALDWLASGRRFYDLPGVMLHAPEAWGSQPYMSHWDREHGSPRRA